MPEGSTRVVEALRAECEARGGVNCDTINEEMAIEMLYGNATCVDPLCLTDAEADELRINLIGMLSRGRGGVGGRTATTSWGRTVQDFRSNPNSWRQISAHAEPATSKAYPGGTSIEQIFQKEGTTLVRHRVIDPRGNVVHETFRPYGKFGEP